MEPQPSAPPRKRVTPSPAASSRTARGWVLTLLTLPFLISGNDRPTQLEQVQQRGSLILLTRNGATSYYLGVDGPTGPEYVLVRAFCEFLGVTLEVEVHEPLSQLFDALHARSGDLIAANLARTPERELEVTFGPDYLETDLVAVTRQEPQAPDSLADLPGHEVAVIADSSYEETLESAVPALPGLRWESRADVGIADLLQAVADGVIDVTIVDAMVFDLNRPFYPRLEASFPVAKAVPHAWAFRSGPDDSLAQRARVFLHQFEGDGKLAAILDEFYSPPQRLGHFDMFHFLQRVRQRLPPLIEAFRAAGESNGIDWRLLAAVGYQESHWDPAAASRTGVRGVMMLTEQTAAHLGVADRLDPVQSIEGGARYINRLRNRLPQRIPEADRTWMALAAYNLGMGHLRDARILTQKRGLDPDSWNEVAGSLGLLTQETWFSQTRHGYARGFEARTFVENVRRYHDALVWMDTRDHPLLVAQNEPREP